MERIRERNYPESILVLQPSFPTIQFARTNAAALGAILGLFSTARFGFFAPARLGKPALSHKSSARRTLLPQGIVPITRDGLGRPVFGREAGELPGQVIPDFSDLGFNFAHVR